MLRPKKTIPALVIGAMALFGCGDDSGPAGTGGTGGGAGGTAGTGGGTGGAGGGAGGAGGMGGITGTGGIGGAIADALNAWCMVYDTCMPYQYSCLEVWGSFPNVVSPPECLDQLTSYFNCGSMLDCTEFVNVANSCADELDAFCECCTSVQCESECFEP